MTTGFTTWRRNQPRHLRLLLREMSVEKQRMKYAEWRASQEKHPKNQHGTLAWVIERVINDVLANPDMPQYGRTKMGRLRMLQASKLGAMAAAQLTKQDFVEHVKARRRDGIGQATAMHDVTCIGTSIDHYMETWSDIDLKGAKVEFNVAKKFMTKKLRLIGKANVRKRRPTDEEVAKIMEACERHDARPRTTIRMADFVAFGMASSRRRGEICRMTWDDVDFEGQFYIVRDLKHPTKKKGNDKKFLLWPELATIIKRQPRVEGEERIFPFRPNSISASYCAIKNALKAEYGICDDLRLHDNRRDCISKWLMKYRPDEVKLWGSGHEPGSKTLETTYDGRDPLEVAKAKIPEFARRSTHAIG